MPRLLTLLASRVASLVNYSDLSRSLGLPQSTLKRYLTLLEATFLVRLLPAWSANIGKRLIKSPKLMFSDTGVLAHLLGRDAEGFTHDRTAAGHALENFVMMEITKQLGWSQIRCQLFHFRAETGQEVDIVLEDRQGRLVGIEVKATASIKARDIRGLHLLAELTGDRFVRGIMLYTGETVVPFASNLHAVPIPALWAIAARD
jgi:predicted AAA+ superfamily ATPase